MHAADSKTGRSLLTTSIVEIDTLLYRGDAASSLKYAEEAIPQLRRCMLLQIQALRHDRIQRRDETVEVDVHVHEAADHYQAALKRSPGNGVWWMGLGISLQAQSLRTQARDAYLQAQAAGLAPELQEFVQRRLAQEEAT